MNRDPYTGAPRVTGKQRAERRAIISGSIWLVLGAAGFLGFIVLMAS